MNVEPLPDKSRLRWHCRRGMKELDVLLDRYLTQHFDQAATNERQAFAELLDCEDPDIWAWLIGQGEPPPEFADVIERIRRHG